MFAILHNQRIRNDQSLIPTARKTRKCPEASGHFANLCIPSSDVVLVAMTMVMAVPAMVVMVVILSLCRHGNGTNQHDQREERKKYALHKRVSYCGRNQPSFARQ